MRGRRTGARRLAVALCAAAFGVLGPAAPAGAAETAADIAHDLSVSGVPGAQVQLAAPTADEAELNPTDLTVPVMRVTLTVPAPRALTGLLPAGGGGLTTMTPSLVVWDLAILEAAKHAARSGTVLAGVSVTTNVQGQPAETQPDLVYGLSEDPPPTNPPTTMTIDQVKTQVKQNLPVWASSANVDVVDDAAGERVVKVNLSMPPSAFVGIDVRELSDRLALAQGTLTEQGGNVGRATVQINDQVSGDPLYVSGDDVTIGARSYWDSPLVAGFLGAGLLGEQSVLDTTGVDTPPVP